MIQIKNRLDDLAEKIGPAGATFFPSAAAIHSGIAEIKALIRKIYEK
jgi:hypothetical protein